MSPKLAISCQQLSKCYTLYNKPEDRLKQFFLGKWKKYYQEFWALRNCDLEVYKGETLGIVGRNGSGKSTLLQLICGTVTPTSGSVNTYGRIAALLELGAGFNPEFTGRENVYINAAVMGLNEDEISQRFEGILAFSEIGRFIDQPVKTYSSGMFARLAFSVAIHVDPEILIVDEILAVGDAAFQRKCMKKFYDIRDSGCTILFVAHDAYQVRSLCERAIYLRDGQRVAYGDSSEVIERYTYDLEQSSKATVEEAPKPLVEEKITGSAPTEHALFLIEDVKVEDTDSKPIDQVVSGQDIQIRMRYRALVENFPELISFVVNFYRHDDLYICGTTTIMEGMPALKAEKEGEVLIKFPNFRMLAGNYKWRVAINDHVGFVIHAEAKNICPIRVIDNFKAVGLIDLPRSWEIKKAVGE